jgi:hypothetical protein
MYVYNISGGVATIFYQSCAQIDNNQQAYEAQIQVPRCNSILKAKSKNGDDNNKTKYK